MTDLVTYEFQNGLGDFSIHDFSTSADDYEQLAADFHEANLIDNMESMKLELKFANTFDVNIENQLQKFCPNIYQMIAFKKVISYTSIGPERVFSSLSFVNNRYRNMTDERLKALLFIYCNGIDVSVDEIITLYKLKYPNYLYNVE